MKEEPEREAVKWKGTHKKAAEEVNEGARWSLNRRLIHIKERERTTCVRFSPFPPPYSFFITVTRGGKVHTTISIYLLLATV